ncbi:NAD(P)-binding domain protein [Niveomyces insectorum RCEF 264]|uniref:NAD(P)-binding domain protein n=1 Tax=Niveomyces insectorum RCEF 264 TaxID=1081102 RepID=A0A162JCD3_9HYPO|nr:NAD(P)-binding domain protein [Niveomyces insectorum RCEF 264]
MAGPSPRPGQKTVLITGCTPGGIGHAMAQEFHSKGLYVIATARRIDVLAGVADQGMAAVALDVTSKESIAACKKTVADLTGGRLDILVNNAGRTMTVPATDLDMDEVRGTFELNVFGVMAMCQAFAPLLIAARGLVVNVASISAVAPYVFGAAYCASKGAVVAYSRCLRQELRPFGVRVTVVMAGTVRSNIVSAGLRTLPADSLYQPVAELYARRQVYSQTIRTMDTAEFARQVANGVLAPEAPLAVLRGWLGLWRPDWLYCGGMARIVYLGTLLGEWMVDRGAWRTFGLQKLKNLWDQKQKAA